VLVVTPVAIPIEINSDQTITLVFQVFDFGLPCLDCRLQIGAHRIEFWCLFGERPFILEFRNVITLLRNIRFGLG